MSELEALTCSRCGGSLVADGNSGTYRCEWCGTAHVAKHPDEGEESPAPKPRKRRMSDDILNPGPSGDVTLPTMGEFNPNSDPDLYYRFFG